MNTNEITEFLGHFSIEGVIPIGGAHIQPAKPLPDNIKTFLDGAEHGAIYFSLGSNLRSSLLPAHRIQAFLSEFLNWSKHNLICFDCIYSN